MIHPFATTLVTGIAGAGLAAALGAPAPYLTGPASCVTLAGLLGLRTDLPEALRLLCFTVIGAGLGAGVTPATVAAAARWPVSLLLLTAAILAIFLVGATVLRRGFGFDRTTALLSASPGHLSFVLGLGADTGADLARLSITQALRVLVLTLLVPLTVALVTDADMSMQPAAGATMAPAPLAATLAVALALGWTLDRWRAPAGYLLGGMIASAAAHLTQFVPGLVPAWLAVPAFVVMGMLIGTRFSGVSWRVLRGALGGALCLTAVALAAALVGALAVTRLTGLPLIDALIAFAPGGLETMAAMAVILGADPAFVAVHHVWRLVFLSFAVPVVLASGRFGRDRP